MNRRDFLKHTAPLLAAPVVINGVRLNAFAGQLRWYRHAAMSGAADRVLVIIQLEGGNDGLNTIIPVDDDHYYELRPKLAIAKNDALPLAGQPLVRFHAAMPGMRAMFDDGMLAVVGNIGYPHATLSHFASTEIWNTGSGGRQSEYQRTGWIGRYLKREFPEYPDRLPSDPPAIEIGGATSSLFTVIGSSIGMSLTDPAEFYALVNGGPHVSDDGGAGTPAAKELEYISTIDRQSQSYAGSIRAAAEKAANRVPYPDTPLGASLAIVARLIAGGLSTRVYKVTLGNFDTHFNQAEPHANLLGILSGAVKAFQDDLIALDVDDRVVGMTYSEFGRRPRDNGSGTDHGTSAPHFVFGSAVDGGKVHGGMPDLGNLDQSGNYQFTYAFHCYYASVLAPFFGLDAAALRDVLPIGDCSGPDLIPLYHTSSVGGDRPATPVVERRVAVHPNPARDHATIAVTLPHRERVTIDLRTVDGRHVRRIIAGDAEAGSTSYSLDCASLPPGAYIIALRSGGETRIGKLTIVR